jgi:hypothetical protein
MYDEKEDMIDRLKAEVQSLRDRNSELTGISATNFSPRPDNNLIQLQLDTSYLLSNIEHFLRGDTVIIDDKGNEIYQRPQDPDQIVLNEFGINLVMSTIGEYIDKNTFLSFYTVERIYEILADLGEELSDVIFCNYEKMGLTTEFKKSRYKLIVLTILHTIESAYRRAISGKAVEELNTSRLYTPSSASQMRTMNAPIKKPGFFNKLPW